MKTKCGRVARLGFLALWVMLPGGAASAEQVYYMHNDHLGTPQAMSDALGRKVWEATYEPFGKVTVNTDPDGDGNAVINNLRFPGQYYDAETGLHYNYHRDYDPETGRFLQPDPIGLWGGLNLYGYVLDNPVNWIDPSGLRWWAGAGVIRNDSGGSITVTGDTLGGGKGSIVIPPGGSHNFNEDWVDTVCESARSRSTGPFQDRLLDPDNIQGPSDREPFKIPGRMWPWTTFHYGPPSPGGRQ